MELQTYYEEIKNDIEAIAVLTQPKEIVALYRKSAKKMEEIGDYRDAAELALIYREKATQAERDGKEYLYAKACQRMESAQSVVERKLAIEMLKGIRGYKDADALCEECERKNLRELRRKDIRDFLIVAVIVVAAVLYVYYH